MPLLLSLLTAVLLALSPLVSPTAQEARAEQEFAGPQPVAWAARVGDTSISFEELDRLLLGRYALSKMGRETMLFMLKLRVVDAVAQELGFEADPAQIQAMMDDIENDVVASGTAKSLAEYLRKEGISEAEFEESLRPAVLQRELARRALGIAQGEPVSGEQQEVWLENQIQERGLQEFAAPWDEGLVLACAGVTLGRDEFIEYLRSRIKQPELRVCMTDLLRVKRMRARMPDLGEKGLARAIEEEIQGRRNEVNSDPKYQGISYEQLLESQGILYATWPEDPAVQQAALARLWVERKYDEASLRRVYEDERELFDARHGEAIETWVLYLRAAEHKNELIRDFGEAEELLYRVREAVSSKLDFQQRIQLLSEDKGSREKQGLLGWITRPAGESPTREAIFAALDSGEYKPSAPEDSLTRLIGPVRTESGVLLLWLGRRRPAPAWTEMVVYVARELRRRFTEESLDPREVVTKQGPSLGNE